MSIAFMQALETTVCHSQHNNFGAENFDEYRFGKYNRAQKSRRSAFQQIKGFLKSKLKISNPDQLGVQEIRKLIPNPERFINLYEALQEKDKALLISLLAYRVLGYQKVWLPRNTQQYWKMFETVRSLENKFDTYDPHYFNFILTKFDLNPIGINIKLYYADIGIIATFLLEQYAYKLDDKRFVAVEKNDIVLDLGACYGDTALYFASQAGEDGKVYSFEFIPGNLKLLNINLDLNPNLRPIIEIVQYPVSDRSNDTIFYQDRGPSSRISSRSNEEQTDSATTISIDDFVRNNNIQRVDFIKMDIEGAEMPALRGAIETIRKFRPKLAIAIYHSINDMIDIPSWILNLDEGYEIFLDHFTIHEEETVCFAKVK